MYAYIPHAASLHDMEATSHQFAAMLNMSCLMPQPSKDYANNDDMDIKLMQASEEAMLYFDVPQEHEIVATRCHAGGL